MIDLDDGQYHRALRKELVDCIIYVTIVSISEWLLLSSKLSLSLTVLIVCIGCIPVICFTIASWKVHWDTMKIIEAGLGKNERTMICRYCPIKDGYVYEQLKERPSNEDLEED